MTPPDACTTSDVDPDDVCRVFTMVAKDLACHIGGTEVVHGHFSVLYPFVCQRGRIVPTVGFDMEPDVAAVDVTRCTMHNYTEPASKAWRVRAKKVCRIHPVVTPAHLAAIALGGNLAAATVDVGLSRGESDLCPWAYHPVVFDAWAELVRGVVTEVKAYDTLRRTTKTVHLGTLRRIPITPRPGVLIVPMISVKMRKYRSTGV